MITNEGKCRHLMEYVMSSKVCKRCGYIERAKNTVYSPVPAQ